MSANQEDPFKVTSWMMYQESSTDQRHKTRNRLMRSFSVSFKKRRVTSLGMCSVAQPMRCS